jgi:hypothetical protein
MGSEVKQIVAVSSSVQLRAEPAWKADILTAAPTALEDALVAPPDYASAESSRSSARSSAPLNSFSEDDPVLGNVIEARLAFVGQPRPTIRGHRAARR